MWVISVILNVFCFSMYFFDYVVCQVFVSHVGIRFILQYSFKSIVVVVAVAIIDISHYHNNFILFHFDLILIHFIKFIY